MPPQVPFSQEAEESLIGSILIDSNVLKSVRDIVTPADLFDFRASVIYGIMLSINSAGLIADQITVWAELDKYNKTVDKSRQIEPYYLAHLISSVPTSLHAENYACIIKNTSLYRELLVASQKIQGIANLQPPDINAAIDKCEAAIENIRQKFKLGSRRLILGEPRLIQSHPPRYIWNVNGKDLQLNLSDITSWKKFRSTVISELNFIPIPPKNWDEIVNGLITRSEQIAAPVDASEEQQLKITILGWFERRREASDYTDLKVGMHVLRTLGGVDYYCFQSTPLLEYIKHEYKRNMASNDLWLYMYKWKAVRHEWRISRGDSDMPVKLWCLPTSFADEVPITSDSDTSRRLTAEMPLDDKKLDKMPEDW